MRAKTIAVVLAAIVLTTVVSTFSVLAVPRGEMNKERENATNKENKPNLPVPKMSAMDFHDQWRKLWEDDVWWTRMVIIGVLDDLGGAGNYTARLLQNVPDMVNTLKPFYGESATQLGNLLQDHLLIAAQILTEAKAGHNITQLVNTWYQNANAISMKMNQFNPKFWNLVATQDFWKMHLDLTLEEAVAHLSKDWAADVAAFDKIHVEALKMADFISSGIVKQFPNTFTAIGNIPPT